jgi:hypothetical protein
MGNFKIKQITWSEDNSRNDAPLHIANRGERYSTVTGVTWLNDKFFVAVHRNGLAIALFALNSPEKPLLIKKIKHLSDDIASYQINENTWELIVSGCWELSYTKYTLTLSKDHQIKLLEVRYHRDKTFCHGVDYDIHGDPFFSYSTGQNPRIEFKHSQWKLPGTWGPRDTCFSSETGNLYAIAVSEDPKRKSYNTTASSIWQFNKLQSKWLLFQEIKDTHTDACCIYKNRIWLGDQKSDRVLGFCLDKKQEAVILKSKLFNFPHGLAISKQGIMAVTNYGNTSITLIDISEIK